MKRVLKIVLVLFVVLIALVVCLPWLASTGGVRNKVLAKVNEAMPGTLAVDDWSFKWLGSSTVDGISFEDGQGTKVNVSGVRVEKGLLALARNPNDFGRVEVIEPVATVAMPVAEEATTPPSGEAPPVPEGKPSAKPPKAEPAKPIPMPDFHGTLVITRGSVSVVKPDGSTVSAVRNLDVDVGLNGAGEPLTYDVSFASGEAEGNMQVQGEVNLGSGKELVPEEVLLDTVVNIEALDLGALSALAGVAAAPQVVGALTGNVSAKGGLAKGLAVVGTIKIPGLSMSGGPFKGDTPSLGDVLLNVNGTFADESINVSNLLFRSSLANLSAGGRVGKDADGEFTVDATIDLAAALSQFPETAGLQEGVTLNEGKVKITAKVAREGTTSLLEANAGIDRLRGMKDGQILSWDVPTTVDVKGAVGEDLMKLDLFRIQSPFLTGEGKGDLENMDATIHADVQTALTELRKFVKIEPWDAAGQLDLTVHLEPGEQNLRAVRGALSITQATVSNAGKTLVPSSPLQVSFSSQVRLPDAMQGLEARGSQLSWKAWLGEGNVNVDRVQLPLPSPTGETPMPSILGVHHVAQVDLARVTDLLHGLELLDADLRLAGTSSIQAKLSLDKDRLDLTDASIEIANLLVGQGEKELREASITVRTAGGIEPTAGSVKVPALDVTFSPGAIRVRDVVIGKGERDELALKARVEGDLNLETLLTMLGDFAAMPEGTHVAGMTKLRLNVDAPGKGQSRIDAQLDIEKLRVTSKDGPAIAEEKIELAAVVLQDPATSAVVLENLTVVSVPVNLSATANFVPGELQKDLTADGSVALDLEALGNYLNALVGMDVVLKGKEKRPFHLRTSWTGAEGENVMTRTEFNAGLSAELIEAFGMRMESLDVPLVLSNGVARVDLSAGVNGGNLRVRPVIDFTQADSQLVLENPSNVLVNVELSEAIAEQLLSRIHPLFKGATALGGTLDLHMDQFVWPLDAAALNQAKFNGVMQFRDLSMQSGGLLGKVLEVAKVAEKDMSFGDRKIEFRCENGRISCSPTRFKVDGNEIELSGSIGLDETLAYAALIPVSEKLVGAEAFKYLEGTTIRLPIGGTVSKPDLGTDVFAKALGDLTRQAVGNAAKKAIQDNAGKLLEGLFK